MTFYWSDVDPSLLLLISSYYVLSSTLSGCPSILSLEIHVLLDIAIGQVSPPGCHFNLTIHYGNKFTIASHICLCYSRILSSPLLLEEPVL